MTTDAAHVPRRNVHPLWLMPSMMTVVAFYENMFSFGGLVVQFCRLWLDYSRRVWESLFGLVPANYLHGSAALYDLLTLWFTASIAVWVFPKLTPSSDGRVKTTASAVREALKLPAWGARLLGFVMIVASIAILAAPFGAFDAAPSSLASALQMSQLVSGGGLASWLAGPGIWFSSMLVALGAASLCYVYFWIGPQLETAELTPAERRDLLVIAVGLWAISAGLLLLAVIVPLTSSSWGSANRMRWRLAS